jgi:hypothetical protein
MSVGRDESCSPTVFYASCVLNDVRWAASVRGTSGGVEVKEAFSVATSEPVST